MGEGEFEIIEHAFDVPFRTRNVNAGHIAFRADDLDVYVLTDVASRARQWARNALPRETGGLLAGRILRDNAGRYAVVTGIACAPAGAGGMGRFVLSPEETDLLRRALARDHPSADVVGWWHSHTAPSAFSPTDRANQAIWTDPRSVGLLVFAEGTPWAAVYVGPQSRGPFQPHGPVAALDRHSPGSYRPQGEPPERPSPAGENPGTRRRLALAVLIGVMALGIIALAVKALLPGPGSAPSVDLSCAIIPDGNIPIAQCSVDHVEAGETVRWYANNSDTVLAIGSTATFHLRPGANVVRVAITHSDHGEVQRSQITVSAPQ